MRLASNSNCVLVAIHYSDRRMLPLHTSVEKLVPVWRLSFTLMKPVVEAA